MSMSHSTRFVDDIEVRPGALITRPMTQDRLFGRQIRPGARCDAIGPESWTAVICADSQIIWEGESGYPDDLKADAAARGHARQRIDEHLRTIFA